MTDIKASIYVVAALVGNMWRESHVNPNCGEVGGGSGWGLAQWSGDRRTNLLNYLTSQGLEASDGNGQLEFLILENDWINNYGEFNSLTEFLQSNSTDTDYLTECFMKCWERPGIPELEERQQFASDWLEWYKAGNRCDGDWIKEPVYYLGRGEAYLNSCLVYKFFGSNNNMIYLLAKHKKNRRKRNANKIIQQFQ